MEAAELVAIDDAGRQGFGADEGLTHSARVAGGGDNAGRVAASAPRPVDESRTVQNRALTLS
ncbi:hypothetical protein A5717_07910 [Mycolicibacterium porcinum]|nr:hypothetical protein A5717_07910 [Mycolicibacterium porcinum]